MIRRHIVGALLAGALLVPAAALAATTYSGSKSDARGDVPSYGDVLKASAVYNPKAGSLKAKFVVAAYADAAAHRTVIGGFFAKLRRGHCDTSAGAAITLETDTKVAAAGVAANGHASPPKPAAANVNGNTIMLSAHGSRFKGKRWNCVVVETLVPTGPTTSDELDKLVVRLRPKH